MREKERIAYWDTMKGGLMLLVVLAHYLWYFQTEHSMINFLVDFIYMFHMPAFVFISGYFSKSEHSRGFQSLMKLLAAYILINGSLMLWSLANHQGINYIEPYNHCWYLLALIAWRLTIGYVSGIRYILPLSVLVALLVGYVPEINNVLAMKRIIAFYPFFIAGFMFPANKVATFAEKRLSPILPWTVVLLAVIVAVLASNCFHYSDEDLLMSAYQNIYGGMGRTMLFFVAALMIVGILHLTPVNAQVPLLTAGGRHSLSIYLLHRYFTFGFEKYCHLESEASIMMTATVLTFLTYMALKTDFVSNRLYFLISEGVLFLTPGEKTRSCFVRAGYMLLIASLLMAPMANAIVKHHRDSAATDTIYRVMTPEQQDRYRNACRILFAGDLILLEDQVKLGYTGSGYDFSMNFAYTKDYIESADFAIGVFEGPMAGEDAGYSASNYGDGKKLHLNFPDAWGKAVKESGFDLVTTANNHVLDRGLPGVRRTLDVMDTIGLAHLGSYRSETEKQKQRIRVVEKNGLRIAVLAYTYGANGYTEDDLLKGELQECVQILVSPQSKHFATVKAKVEKDFAEARSCQPDIIVVLPHMGTEFKDEPDKFQKAWRDIFYANGADIVLGDHTHSVQPIEMEEVDGKMRLTAYCPGNYANIYREHDGDCSVLEEIYIDKDTKEIIGGAIIPMWTVSALSGNYRPLPIGKILVDAELQKNITTKDLERIKEAISHISTVMLGENIPLDILRERLFFDAQGFLREPAEALPISDKMKTSPFLQAVTAADKVCFVGDSVTEGTKNGGYGWYEPLIPYMSQVSAFAKGGRTTRWLLDNAKNIADRKADLYVVAIGCNDIRYRDHKVCAMTAEEYEQAMENFVTIVRSHNETAKFVFIAPWTSTDGDKISRLGYEEKMAMYHEYSIALNDMCARGGHLFVNPNGFIEDKLKHYPQSMYLIDFIHPNSKRGIQLYCKAVLWAATSR